MEILHLRDQGMTFRQIGEKYNRSSSLIGMYYYRAEKIRNIENNSGDITLDTKIDNLYGRGVIDVRTTNCLKNHGFKSLRDVIESKITIEELLKIPNFGKVGAKGLEMFFMEKFHYQIPREEKIFKQQIFNVCPHCGSKLRLSQQEN